MRSIMVGAVGAAALLLSVSVGRAQDLAAAEAALERGRAAEAQRIAQALLEEGTRAGAELGPLYRVLGVAAASAGDEEVARRALTCWLAIVPDGRIEGATDEVRSVLMEARGTWAVATAAFGATAELADDLSGLVVHVSDPGSMAARVRARVRLPGGAWSASVAAPAPELTFAVAGLSAAHELDYSLAFIDEYGNRVWLAGSDEAPLHLAAPAPVAVVDRRGPTSPPPAATADATPFHAVGVVGLTLGAGTLVGAAIAHAERERVAGVYNGDGSGCTGSGATRGELCGLERDQVLTMESVAIALYVTGTVLVGVGAGLIAAAPSAAASPERSVACAPAGLGVACVGTF